MVDVGGYSCERINEGEYEPEPEGAEEDGGECEPVPEGAEEDKGEYKPDPEEDKEVAGPDVET